jgi:hypothetical protein
MLLLLWRPETQNRRVVVELWFELEIFCKLDFAGVVHSARYNGHHLKPYVT